VQELSNTLTLDKFSLTLNAINFHKLLTLNALGLNGLVSYRSLFLNASLLGAYRLTLNVLHLVAFLMGFGLRLVGWWVVGGACVISSLCVRTVSAVVLQVKSWAYGLLSAVSAVVLCQYRVTSCCVVAVPCFASGILHGVTDTPRPHDLHAHTSPDPHTHNFGARYDIHPTLTPTTFSPFKNTCSQGQYINNAMEAQHETR